MGEPPSNSDMFPVLCNSTHVIAASSSLATPSACTAISDSGANSSFFRMSDSSWLSHVIPTTSPVSALLPNGSSLFSTHEGILNLDFLPLSSRRVHIFSDSSLSSSLIGIGIFTDAGFQVIYDSLSVQVVNSKGDILLHGDRDSSSKLWVFSLPTPLVVNNLMQLTRHADLALFYNRCFCSCANSTMEAALKSKILEIPGLPLELYKKNMPNHVAQAFGHLDRTRRGLHSTRRKHKPPSTLSANNTSLEIPVIYVKDFSSRIQTDATGRFPFKSVNGYLYVLLFYVEDSNYIHVELLRDRQAASYTAAYQRAFEFFKLHNIPHQIVRLDNETSTQLLKLFSNLGMKIEIAPPANHRTLSAERHIRTWKNHFISTLSTCDPSFPLDAWEFLIPHAECTLNLLRPSITTPTVSAWEQVCGKFNFNAVPLAPPGTRAVILDDPKKRGSWAKHGTECFYVGPAFSHYRCYTFYVPSTQATRVSDSISWLPQPTLMSPPTPYVLAQLALEDLSMAFKQLSNHTSDDISNTFLIAQKISSLLSTAILSLDPSNTPPHISSFPCIDPFNIHTSPQILDPVIKPDATLIPAVIPRVVTPILSVNNNIPVSLPRVQAPIQSVYNNIPVSLPRVQAPIQPVYNNIPVSLPRVSTPITVPPTSTISIEVPTIPSQTSLLPTFPVDLTLPVTSRVSSRYRKPTSRYFVDSVFLPSTYHEIPVTDVEQKYINFVEAAIASDIESPASYGVALAGPNASLWAAGFAAEIHRLVVKTKTGKFVSANTKPPHQRVAYARIVCRLKQRLHDHPEYRVRITYGRTTPGESSYSGDLAAYTASIATVKLLFNATLSEMAHLLTSDITDFYLGTDIASPEYMWIPLKYFSSELIKKYNLDLLQHNGLVLMELNKSIYGLPQAGILSQQKLIQHLNFHGYTECPHTSCLFQHATRNTKFTLVVDDFAVKYDSKEDADHLLNALSQIYTLRTDWNASLYLGMKIVYTHGSPTLTISMPSYVPAALKTLGATNIGKCNTPMLAHNINYGTKQAQMAHVDTTPALNPARTKRLQVICGILLYYSRTLDFRIATAVNSLSSRQSKPTEEVELAATRLLQYLNSHPTFSITYRRSDMRLITHADASHHSESKSRSRAGGVHYLGDNSDDSVINGPIDCYSIIIDVVCAGTFESEYAALFISCQKAVVLRNTLQDLGYPQGPTLVVSDNQCASGIASDSVTQRRSKAMDTRFHWTRDRVRQGQFQVIWRPGLQNLADIFTKALPVQTFNTAAANLSLSPSSHLNLAHVKHCAMNERVC